MCICYWQEMVQWELFALLHVNVQQGKCIFTCMYHLYSSCAWMYLFVHVSFTVVLVMLEYLGVLVCLL